MLFITAGVLCIFIIILCIKLYRLKRSAREMADSFAEKIQADTNTQIDISSRDRDMVYLAESINIELSNLREEHHHFHQGDAELKMAITNISHDLRTPLTAICGYLDMMGQTDDPEKISHYVEIMKDRAALMKELTEELFRYSVIISDDADMETENIFINQVLEESIAGFFPALTGSGIQPEISLTDKRIERMANRQALSRVFSNLLNNAVKYSDGDLAIELSDTGEITFSNTAKRLSVVQVEQLFDRFYTVEVARDSTGLGLSIARTLIKRMGGRIFAEYKDGRLIIRIILSDFPAHTPQSG